jgi:hypothetical protein
VAQLKRPKARGLAQHGGPPGWLEESDPAGCDGRPMPPALTDYTTCPRSRAHLLLNGKRLERKEGMTWYSCLLSGPR